jgi:hypothetical protein
MFKGKVLLFSLLLVFATSLYAGPFDPCLSTAGIARDITGGCTVVRVNICPQGDFEFIYDGCGAGADSSFIWIIALDGSSNGVPGIPWTDYWLNACDPAQELYLCTQPIQADSLTNANGETTISGRIAGGGCILTEGIYIAVQGKIIEADPPTCIEPLCLTDIQIVSPDVNASGTVSLADFQPFVATYNKGEGDTGYNACCDYNDNGSVTLSDFAFFAEHYNHECF